jgi:hypothetical protein
MSVDLLDLGLALELNPQVLALAISWIQNSSILQNCTDVKSLQISHLTFPESRKS